MPSSVAVAAVAVVGPDKGCVGLAFVPARGPAAASVDSWPHGRGQGVGRLGYRKTVLRSAGHIVEDIVGLLGGKRFGLGFVD